jgi:hypothetical protein
LFRLKSVTVVEESAQFEPEAGAYIRGGHTIMTAKA